ncbi:hypothetical protein Tco_0201917 [Tanacetum coccineum]
MKTQDKIFSRPPWWESIHFTLEKRTTGGGIKSIANMFTRLNVKLMINFNFCPTSMYKSDLGDCHYACKYCNATYISGIEAAWGANKTKNGTENGREQVLGIKRWSVGMRLREMQRR